MNYTKFLSKISKLREPSAIRTLMPFTKLKGMISLAAGLPNQDTFPFSEISFKLKDNKTITIKDQDLNDALQYSNTNGLNKLNEWVVNHQKEVYKPKLKSDKWSVLISNGSQDSLSKSFEMLIDEGDSILIENPTYSGAIAAISPLKPNVICVETDSKGIIPKKLKELLENLKKMKKSLPKLLYTIPHSSNPTGVSISNERKVEIYKIAQEFNFLILEDDPYYYLTLGNNDSFLKYDSDGRVLRFDSLSKVLSSGLRIGWVSGPIELVNRINLHMQSSSLHTSGVSQSIAYSLLNHWEMKGFNNHIKDIQSFYKNKRDLFIELCDKYLKDYASWNIPSGGMFIWIKLNDIEDSKLFIEKEARENLILLVPGQYFHPLNKSGPFVRAAYSVESKENMELALSRLANLLKKFKK